MGDAHDHDQDPPDSLTMTLNDILDDLDDAGNLSDWELDFVDDMLRKRAANPDLWDATLSHKQEAKLRAIWESRCG